MKHVTDKNVHEEQRLSFADENKWSVTMKGRNESIWVRWLKAYCFVVIIMCVLFFLGTLAVLNVVEKDANDKNSHDAEFIQKTLDENWEQVLNYCLVVVNNDTSQKLDDSKTETSFLQHPVYELSYDIKSYTDTNGMIESAYLYYPKVEYVIGDRGVYDTHAYWCLLYGVKKSPLYDYDEWKELVLINRKPGYFVVQHEADLELYYKMCMPQEDGRMLIVKINSDRLSQLLGRICNDQENDFMAMINNDNVIYSYAGNYGQFAEPQTNKFIPPDGDEYLYTELYSAINTLRYVTITEKSIAYDLTNTISKLAFVSLLLAFVFGVAMTYAIARSSARPIEAVAAKLNESNINRKNEIALISRGVDQLLGNQHTMTTLLNWQAILIRRSFLKECLSPLTSSPRSLEDLAAVYGVEFNHDCFAVIVREPTDNRTAGDAELITDMLALTVEDYHVCWAQLSGLDVFLINFDSNTTESVSAFIQMLKNRLTVEEKIVASNSFLNLDDVRDGYRDCLKRLKRNTHLEAAPSTIDYHGDYNQFLGKSAFYSFSQFVINGDYRDALHLVDELCLTYFFEQNAFVRKCKRYQLAQLFMPILNGQYSQLQVLTEAESEDEFKSVLKAILVRLEKANETEEDPKDVAVQIRMFIDEHYALINLDLQMITEAIEISPSHASRIFKKRYEIGIVQYVNRVRVMHAKELIRSSNMNLNDIAVQVGFSNDMHLIRVFKKQEAITPGAFRKQEENKKLES